jgi:hypothetical protein
MKGGNMPGVTLLIVIGSWILLFVLTLLYYFITGKEEER